MTFVRFCTLALAGVFAVAAMGAAQAGERRGYSDNGAAHSKSQYYRKGPQVRGYSRRAGGYSYDYQDSINTYGDAQGRYGSADKFRDPQFGRQTTSGPFDNGFFFDSGVAPRGGDSPYLN